MILHVHDQLSSVLALFILIILAVIFQFLSGEGWIQISDREKSHWPLRKRQFQSQNKTGWRSNNWGVVWQWGPSVTEIAGGRCEQQSWPPCLAAWGNHCALAKERAVWAGEEIPVWEMKQRVSEIEGKKLTGFVMSPEFHSWNSTECSGRDNRLALQKWRLPSSEVGRNWERIVFLLITNVVHFLFALWVLNFSGSISVPSLLSCTTSNYKDKWKGITETRRLRKWNDLVVWKLLKKLFLI